MSSVPESLTNRLGPLASEANGTAPAAPNSDVREKLETALPPRRQPLESRLGRPNDQNQTSSQISTSASNLPATIPAPAWNSSASTVPSEGVESSSVLLWNRPYLSEWGQYKAEMVASLNMNTLTCRSDARRMMNGNGPKVSGLYTVSGLYLGGLPQDKTIESPTEVQRIDTTSQKG